MAEGRRLRFIRESVYRMILASLGQLGWFDETGRNHQPINPRSRPVEDNEEIPVNTLAVTREDSPSDAMEMGSNARTFAHAFWVDFYAEDDAVGEELIGDVGFILQGLHPAAGREFAVVDIYDYDQATPMVIATCEIEDVVVDRAHDFTQAHRKHWYTCRFDVVDDVSS